ncbi:hypothetical protein [Cohnella soli]|uniref:Nucleotide modification associated domain-containing protein n=1 Tax=Cohnella soli TaxID=425005 RepID=A0ABW0HTZ5_9BACL
MLNNKGTLYSYVLTRDYGFAPNPFGGYCTLATCKPEIRKNASVGDWVIGTGSNNQKVKMGNKLLYAMQVTEILGFEEYWNDQRFQYKKPIMNGSKKQKYGDNIYRFDQQEQKFFQIDSHHSLPNGQVNLMNLERDTKGKKVLISTLFWYFGEEAPQMPVELSEEFVKKGVGHKKIKNELRMNDFIEWISTFESGYIARPWLFKKEFERYDGRT